jgi:hypothetical protein
VHGAGKYPQLEMQLAGESTVNVEFASRLMDEKSKKVMAGVWGGR